VRTVICIFMAIVLTLLIGAYNGSSATLCDDAYGVRANIVVMRVEKVDAFITLYEFPNNHWQTEEINKCVQLDDLTVGALVEVVMFVDPNDTVIGIEIIKVK